MSSNTHRLNNGSNNNCHRKHPKTGAVSIAEKPTRAASVNAGTANTLLDFTLANGTGIMPFSLQTARPMDTLQRAQNELATWQRTGKRWLIGSSIVLIICAVITRQHHWLPYAAGFVGGLMMFLRVQMDLRGKIVWSTLARLVLFLAMITVGTVVNDIVKSEVADAALQSTAAFGTAFAVVGLVAAGLFGFFSRSSRQSC